MSFIDRGMRKLMVILFFLLVLPGLSAQEKVEHGITARGGYGFLIAHTKNMQNLVKDHTTSFELRYEARKYNEESWRNDFNFPYMGASFLFYDFGNSEEIGYGYVLLANLGFPLIKGNENFELIMHAGVGPGIISRPFDQQENHKNIAVGSQYNSCVNMLLESRFKLGSRMSVNAGIGMTHFSNGAFRMPNLGLNLPYASLGVNYKLNEVEKPERIKERSSTKRFRLNTVFSYSMKDIYPPDPDEFFPVFNLSTTVDYKYNNKFFVIGGIDIFQNTANIRIAENRGKEITFAENFQLGTSIGFGVDLNKVEFYLQKGIYAVSATSLHGPFYHRLGVRYHVKQFNFTYTVKSHWGRADNFEFGIGYRILDSSSTVEFN